MGDPRLHHRGLFLTTERAPVGLLICSSAAEEVLRFFSFWFYTSALLSSCWGGGLQQVLPLISSALPELVITRGIIWCHLCLE